MADYFSILEKTIAGLPENTAESRALVYTKARAAIDKQLRSRVPAPSEEIINKQLSLLEDAMERLEAAAVQTSVDAEIFEALNAADAFQNDPAPQSATAPIPTVQTSPAQNAAAIVAETSVAQPIPSPQPVEAQQNFQAEPSAPPQPVSLQPEVPLTPVQAPIQASIAEAPEMPAHANQAFGDDPYAPAPAVKSEKRKGLIAGILPYVLALIVIVGGGVGLWLNKDTLLGALKSAGSETSNTASLEKETGNTTTPEPENLEPETPVAAEPEKQEPKANVRLGQNGESVEVEPVVPEVNEEPEQATEQPVILPETLEPEAQTEPLPEEQTTVAEVTPENNTGSQQPENNTPDVGQNAFLYEEGGAGSEATRSEASVVWTLDREAPEAGLPPEAVIRGRVDVGDKGLSVNLSLKRNADDSLTASHIIELLFEVPSDFTGGQIDNVARFVMKATERARGDGLVAVPAKISDGFFFIALNNLPQAIETNERLLVESDWIDIPLVYTTGRRALVTLEKGATGDKVFRDAFEDWKNR